jgi:1-deoxy-D-xylulose-5-phosphate reductoisomerase
MLRLARETMVAGRGAPAVYNAANEIAVAAFLAHALPFLAIPRIVEHVLTRLATAAAADLPSILALDLEARRLAHSAIEKKLF